MSSDSTLEQSDVQAVDAIRGGDAERYRELVERYERRVYALAWSRLGDPHLAEEATQETFIRGYRRLWLLGDGSRFAGWIMSIARHAAINLGVRRRRELDKRRRWALDPSVHPEMTESGDARVCAPEMLRQTLAQLPPAHRECLVLFYLEGKSGAETAAALGISEPASRVRLHRARAALREQLEDRLAASLENLRPGRALAPAIMATVLASSSTKAAAAGGTGGAIVGALAKFTPLKWVVPFASLITILPMMLLSWFFTQREIRNFRDPKGFRARLFREGFSRQIGLMLIFLVLFLVILPRVGFGRGFDVLYLVLGGSCLVLGAISIRRLAINRSPYFVTMTLLSAAFGLVCLAVGLKLVPVVWIFLAIFAQAFVIVGVLKDRPARMDYSLFLRAVAGMLPIAQPADAPLRRAVPLPRAELLRFARFLGSRWLVNNHRWVKNGLLLRSPRVNWSLRGSVDYFGGWTRHSSLLLTRDGTVVAELGSRDERKLRMIAEGKPLARQELKDQVAVAVESAWASFRAGDAAATEQSLGQVPDREVFVVPPGRTTLWRWLRAGIVLVILGGLLIALKGRPWLEGWEPVQLPESDIRAFLNDTTPNPDPGKLKFNSPTTALFRCLVLPPTNLFNADGLRGMREELFRDSGLTSISSDDLKISWLCRSALARRAMTGGWIGWADLGITTAAVSADIHEHQAANAIQFNREFLLTREEAASWVDGKRWPIQRVTQFTVDQLRWLRDVNCLDLVDRTNLARQIASVQVLSSTPAPGQPTIHDWRAVRGLFFTPGWPALEDTYASLAALEILGGLDRIDREQCIRGILRRHQGEGYFTSPVSGGFKEYHIAGGARDTFCAFESLRILGALDRVKDLARWEFRAKRPSKSATGLGPGGATWDTVEAWILQRRFERAMRERKPSPNAPVRSLRQE